MGLSACNFGGDPAPSSSTPSGGGSKEESSMTSSRESYFSQEIFDHFFKGGAFYRDGIALDFHAGSSGEHIFTFSRKNNVVTTQPFGTDMVENPEYFRLGKNPSSLDERITATRYYDREVAGVRHYFYETVEPSLKEIVLGTGLPLISLDYGSFRIVRDNLKVVALRGENVTLSVGESSRSYNIEIELVVEGERGPAAPIEAWRVDSLILTSGQETISVNTDRMVPSDYYPSDATEWVDFHFELNEDGESYTVVDTMLDEFILTVPGEHNGKPVTRIGPNFRGDNYSLSTMQLILPDSITEIDESFAVWGALREIVGKNLGAAPEGMSGIVRVLNSDADSWLDFRADGFILAPYSWESADASPDAKMVLGNWRRPQGKVTLPDGPTVLRSLYGFDDVTDLVVPEGYLQLNPGLFYEGRVGALRNVSLPDSLQGLTLGNSVYVPSSVNYNVKDGLRYLGNATNPYLLCFDREEDTDFWANRKVLSVAEGCKILCLNDLTFYDYEGESQVRFEELYIPSSVRFTAGNLRSDAYSTLTKITWLGGQIQLDYYSVLNDLKELVTGPDVTNSVLSGNVFPNLQKLTLDGGVKPSFFEHKKLQEVVLGESLIEVPNRAFYGCASLSTLTIKNPAVSIGKEAFTGTAISMVEEGDFAYLPVGDNRHAVLLSGEINTATASIHGGVKSIAGSALLVKYADPEITLPSGLITIGSEAFRGTDYSAAHTATIKNLPSTLKNIGNYGLYDCAIKGSLPEGLATIGYGAFSSAAFDNPEIVLPEHLEQVGSDAFSLSNVTKVTFLGDGTPFRNAVNLFQTCRKLKEVVFKSSFSVIPDGMFSGCVALDTFAYPTGLLDIGMRAFSDVSCAAVFDIPEGVVRIGDSVFGDIEGEVTIKLPSTLRTIGTLDISPNVKIAVDGRSNYFAIGEDKSLYNSSFTTLYRYVSGATKEYVMPDSVRSIAQNAFLRSDVRSIVAGKGLSSLTDQAICHAPGLISVDLSAATISVLGNSSIEYNDLLSHIVFPKGLRTMESYAIYGNAFAHLDIPDGVEEIGFAALGNNPLYQVTLPNSLKSISSYAFSGIQRPLEIIYTGDETFEFDTDPSREITIVTPEESRYELRDDRFVTYTDEENKVHLVDVTKDEKVITLPEDIDVIEKTAFSNLTKMEKVIVSDHVSAIDTRLFRDLANHDYVFDWGGDLYDLRDAADAYDGSGIDSWRKEGTTPEGKEIYLPDINTPNNVEITFNVNPHVHTWSDWTVSYPPVCGDPGEDGYKTRTCTGCGTVEGETIEHALEHEYKWEYTNLPTAASLADAYLKGKYKINEYGDYAAMRKGSKTGTCEHCGNIEIQDALYDNVCYFSHVISAINDKGACPDKVNYIQSYLRTTGGWNLTNTYKHSNPSGFAAKVAANTLTAAMWDELSSEYETNSALFTRYWKVAQDASTVVFYEVVLSSRTEAKQMKLLIDDYGRIHTRVIEVGMNTTQEEVIVWAYDEHYEPTN